MFNNNKNEFYTSSKFFVWLRLHMEQIIFFKLLKNPCWFGKESRQNKGDLKPLQL